MLNPRSRTRFLSAWIGLLAYLFVGLFSPQCALALSSVFAGHHEVSIVNQGQEQLIVFGHHKTLEYHHFEEPAEVHADNEHSIFEAHHKSHPDHIVRLSSSQEQTSVVAPNIHFSGELIGSIPPTTPVVSLFGFLKSATLGELANPPPLQPSLAFLRTVILLI